MNIKMLSCQKVFIIVIIALNVKMLPFLSMFIISMTECRMLKNWEDRHENKFGFETEQTNIENLEGHLWAFQVFAVFRSILPIF